MVADMMSLKGGSPPWYRGVKWGSTVFPSEHQFLRRRSSATATAPSAAAGDKDPHAAEREARNRERLLKEARKMARLAGLVGMAGGQAKRRGRGNDGESQEVGAGERRSSTRRKGRRGEVLAVGHGGDEEEERMRMLEADERESARFGN